MCGRPRRGLTLGEVGRDFPRRVFPLELEGVRSPPGGEEEEGHPESSDLGA